MDKRELLMLAKDYVEGKHHVHGWYWSEKLDGVRAFWDGGVTINKPIRDIPWANTGLKNHLVPRGTGLWSRYGNVMCAPDWFIDKLPLGVPLDGELWLAPKCLEETRSIVSRHEPDGRWHAITFNVFDMPSLLEFCKTGIINNPNFTRTINEKDCFQYFSVEKKNMGCLTFRQILQGMKQLEENETLRIIGQNRLPYVDPMVIVYGSLGVILKNNGEGIVVRDPKSYWTPHRVKHFLRVKPLQDAECVVAGYNAGLGKHFGRLGSLVVEWESKQFDLSGFTDAERVITNPELFADHAGEKIPWMDVSYSEIFPLGTIITFRYNGVTNGGLPREARYWRKRDNPM